MEVLLWREMRVYSFSFPSERRKQEGITLCGLPQPESEAFVNAPWSPGLALGLNTDY